MELSLRSVAKSYGGLTVLDGISLDIASGEILCLVGPSGCGKSTLLRMIGGLEMPDSGAVLQLSEPPANSLNPLTYIFQDFALLPWRTVEENVGFGLELAGAGANEIRDSVKAQLDLVGLSDWAGKKVQELSGGMQQRVGLARAFATSAPILLMDEPYSALDPLIRARLQDELIDLQHRLKRTIIFVSHDLDEAIKIGTRIAIMEGGRIVQCGTAKEILDNPASDYVRDFVANMNPLAVCTASDAMKPTGRRRPGEKNAPTVDVEASLKRVMELQLETGLPVYVLDEDKLIGIIEPEDVQRTLLR